MNLLTRTLNDRINDVVSAIEENVSWIHRFVAKLDGIPDVCVHNKALGVEKLALFTVSKD